MKLFISFLLTAFIVQTCYADWPVKKKRLQFVPGYSYYHSKSFFDKTGHITPLGDGNSYTSHYLSLFGMYGISDRLDFFANIPLANQRMRENGVLLTKTGIADISVGLAYHFPSENLKRYFSLKGSFIIPGYQNTTSPYLGYGEKGFQLGASYSLNLSDKFYFDGEANFTRYFDQATGPNQYFFFGTFGYALNDFEKLTFSFSHQLSVSSDKSFSANLAANKDFVSGKITLGYGRRISRTVTPHIEFYFTPYGYNTGSASGINLYAIIKVP